MNFINNGVTAPKGFRASGVACGLKKNGGRDLALVSSDELAAAAGVFTTNVVKGHSLQLTMNHIHSGFAKAVVINSGNANACVGEQGARDASEMAALTASLLACKPTEILVGSTGVIGIPLSMASVRQGIPEVVAALSENGGHEAEQAIMTTDLIPKECAVELDLQGTLVRIGGMAKGSGMIHPNMATMIGVITTDANISPSLLQKALKKAVKRTFNRTSVDGDTSVCDMVVALANGEADHSGIVNEDSDFETFCEALETVCATLARLVARDGEGATKLIEIEVIGAQDEDEAYTVAVSIAKSPLVKTAIFGEDANWGRIITAAGYSGASFDPNLVDISLGQLMVCKNGTALPFDEAKAKEILKKDEVKITVNLKKGICSDRMWTCDFSYDYVKINGSYRS